MIKETEYKKRRKKLLKKLSNNSITVIFSSEFKVRSNDTEYPYRQDSTFYYLTGFKEDNATLVILKKDKKHTKTVLFVQKKDKTMQLWTGKRLGDKKAKKRFCVDAVYSSDDFKIKLQEFIKDKNRCYFDFASKDKRAEILKKNIKNISSYKNIILLVNKMRLIKSASEINLIKKAIKITKVAHHNAIKLQKSKKNEYQLQAQIEYDFKHKGAYSDAYTSIVACGNSANTLHYINNDKPLVDKKLILIDAGCEYNYYASDITRTIPVNGKFTSAQKKLYNLVLKTQNKVIKMIKPKVKRSELQTKSQKMLCKGMVKLGIIKGSYKQAIKKEKYKKYYPHGIGHWMGIDVHDPCPYKNKNNKEILLKEGMILTIEPGIYLDKNNKKIPKKFRGIGIRIEDNILVTKKAFKNLSLSIVKKIKDIERMNR